MNQTLSRATRRIVFVAAPGTEILDLVGPLQVFARATAAITRNERYHEFYAVFFLVQTVVISFFIFRTLV